MKVSDILRIKGDTVQTVLSWNTIAEAATRLAGPPAIGALVVSDDGRRERVDGSSPNATSCAGSPPTAPACSTSPSATS